MAGQLILNFDLSRRNSVKFHNLLTAKATRFQQQLHRRDWYRILMGWIEIEITTANQQVLGIWRLENYEPAGLECAPCFIEKLYERFEWEVFGEMKGSDGAQASVSQRSQISERFTLLDIQRQLSTSLDQDAIRIDSACLKSGFAKHLKPLAAPTSDVEYAGVNPRVSQHGKINFHFFLDLFGCSSQRVFE